MAEKLEIIVEAKDKATGVLGNIKSALGGIGGLAKGALAAGIGATVGGVLALGAGLVDATREAMDAENGQAQLNAVLKSTGGAAGMTADMANDLASSLQAVTRFSDDSVLSGENMLLTFTNIGKDVFPDATKTMLDMSQALGQDVKNSAMQLGKALNDPVQGVTALRRVGVQLTDAQEEQVKALVASGDVMSAQKVILNELQKEFGGAAQAAGNTFAGKLDILKNKFSDIKESIGGTVITALMPLATVIADKIAPAVASFVEANLPKLESFLNTVSTGIGNLLALVSGDDAGGALASIFPPELMALVQPVVSSVQNLVAAFVKHFPQMKAAGADFIAWLMPAFQNILAPILRNIGTLINMVAAWWSEWGGTVIAVVQAAFKVVVTVIGSALALVSGIVTAYIQLVSHDWSGAWETIRSTLANVMNLILSLVGTNLAEFTATWRSNFENAKLIVTTVFNNIVASIRNRLAEFRQMGRNIIQGLVDGAKSMVGSLVSSVTGAVNDAIGAAKKLLGIQSPSKVFAGIGVQMMAGWQQGIEQDSDMPARATARAAQRTLSAARTTQNLAPAFGGLQLVYAPVFSTADRDELEEKLMPIIEAGWRRMQRRV